MRAGGELTDVDKVGECLKAGPATKRARLEVWVLIEVVGTVPAVGTLRSGGEHTGR